MFGNPKIEGKELQECLDCFEAEAKVTAFQTKEADLYNNVMVEYSNSITENPLAASEACKAAKRLSQAATEALRRHEEIKNVPDAASAMHHAWWVALYANAAWASATAAAIEAMSKDMRPDTMYVQKLVKEYQKAWRIADDEDKKFLKRLKVSAQDIAKIVSSATAIGAASDKWEPKYSESKQGKAKIVSRASTIDAAGDKRETKYSESKIVLIKDSEWSVIDGELCRVTDFSPLGSVVDMDGKVQAMDKTTPYASITIECKKLGKNVTGYITHKIDFQHLWAAFKDRTVKEDEEVVIIWTRKHYKKGVKLMSGLMPKLWVMICPKGAYELIIDNNYKPELRGLARYEATRSILEWKPEVME